MKYNKPMRIVLFIAVVILLNAMPAFAQCVNPSGIRGELLFNESDDVFQACTARGWMALHEPAPPLDVTPDAFSFVDQTGVATNTIIISNSVTITGINTPASVTISGEDPDFRIDGGPWITMGTINNGQTLELRITSNAAPSTTNDARVRIGGNPAVNWSVTTAVPDPCETGPVGTRCTSDGAIYAGDTVGGVRLFAAACDHDMTWDGSTCTASQAMREWRTTNTATPVAGSLTDGVANTDAMVTAGIALFPAAEACRNVGAEWYLPARNELDTIWSNLVNGSPDIAPNDDITDDFTFDISGLFPATWYWSSSEEGPGTGWSQRFSNGFQGGITKNSGTAVRCVRR